VRANVRPEVQPDREDLVEEVQVDEHVAEYGAVVALHVSRQERYHVEEEEERKSEPKRKRTNKQMMRCGDTINGATKWELIAATGEAIFSSSSICFGTGISMRTTIA
jgi:hypothetical protein